MACRIQPVPKFLPKLITCPASSSSPVGATQVQGTGRLVVATIANTVRVQQDDWISPDAQRLGGPYHPDYSCPRGPGGRRGAQPGLHRVSHLPEEATARIDSALLVAPADPERKAVLADFAPVPYQRLSYHSIVVASNDDPYCPVRTAAAYARAWGSELVKLQHAGHINVESVMAFGRLG